MARANARASWYFQFALADNPWVKGTVPGVIHIPDTSVVPLVMPIRISFKEIGQSIGPLIKEGRNTDYKFNLTLKLVSDNNAMKNSKVVFKGAGAIKEIVKVVKDEKQEKAAEKKAAKERGEKPGKEP